MPVLGDPTFPAGGRREAATPTFTTGDIAGRFTFDVTARLPSAALSSACSLTVTVTFSTCRGSTGALLALTLLHLQIAYALVWLYLHSFQGIGNTQVYLHSQEEKHRNANTIIEIVVTRKVYILHISHDVRQDSTLLTNVDQCV